MKLSNVIIARHGSVRSGVVGQGPAWCGEVWLGVARRGMAWCGGAQQEVKHNLLLDLDRMTLLNVLRELRRLQLKYRLGDADVYESRHGEWFDASAFGYGLVYVSSWHAIFWHDSIPWERVEEILKKAKCHAGFRYFSLLVGDETLRISPKPDGTPAPRYLFTVKKGGEIVHEA